MATVAHLAIVLLCAHRPVVSLSDLVLPARDQPTTKRLPTLDRGIEIDQHLRRSDPSNESAAFQKIVVALVAGRSPLTAALVGSV